MPVSFHFMDVGMGDGTFIIGPGGENILVDFGSTKNRQVARQDAVQFLKTQLEKRDPAKLELLALTHSDQDHYNQLKHLFAAVDNLEERIDRVLYTGEAPNYKVGDFYDTYLKEWIREDTARTFVANYSNLKSNAPNFNYSGLKIWVVGANFPYVRADPNVASLVLLCEYKDITVILPGDATMSTEDFILGKFHASLDDLSVDLLKLPHHGSLTSSAPEWVAATKPEIVTISADTNPTYNLPRCVIIDRYLPHLERGHNHDYVCYDQLGRAFEVKSTTKLALGSLISLVQGVQYEFKINDDGSWEIKTTDE